MELSHIAAVLKSAAKQCRKVNFIRLAARNTHVRNEREVRKPLLNRLNYFMPLPAGQDKITILKTLSLAKMEGRRGRVAGLIADLLRDIPIQIEAYSLAQKEAILFSCAHVPHIALNLPEIVAASVLQQLKSNSYNPQDASPRVMAGILFSIAQLKMEEEQEELVDLVIQRFLDKVDEETPLNERNISLLLYSLALMGRKLEGELKVEILTALDQKLEELSRQQIGQVFCGLGVLGHLTPDRLKHLKKCIHKVLLVTTPEQVYATLYGITMSCLKDDQLLYNLRLRVGEFIGWKRVTEKNALSMIRCLYRIGASEEECRWTLRGVYPPQYRQAYLDGKLKDVRDFKHTREDKWYPHYPNYFGLQKHYPYRYPVNNIQQYQPDAIQPI